MTTVKPALGKGLSALIGDASPARQPAPTAGNASVAPSASSPTEIDISALKPGKYQPRAHFRLEQMEELAQSVKQNGIMQPILVRPIGEGSYEIVAGERRWRAAKLADLKTVPVLVREMEDKTALELAIVENIQRADLSPVEEAAGYQRLLDEFQYTQEQLAETVGKSRSHVANLLRLQNLPNSVKDMLDRGEITMGHARAILGANNIEELAQEIVIKNLNVRQAEALARRDPEKQMGRPRGSKNGASNGGFSASSYFSGQKDPDILALEEALSDNLGLRVAMNDKGGNQGEVIIHYNNLEELDEVLRRLGGGGF